MDDEMERILLRPNEAARALGCSRTRIYELVHTGDLPPRAPRRHLDPHPEGRDSKARRRCDENSLRRAMTIADALARLECVRAAHSFDVRRYGALLSTHGLSIYAPVSPQGSYPR